MDIITLFDKLPTFLIEKIFLYIKHPLVDMIRDFWIKKLSTKLEFWNNTKYELQFPIRKYELDKLDSLLFKYSWFIYGFRYYEKDGIYGSIKLIDFEEE